jgi:nucleoside-diphosphate-sugar epimerase
VKALVTGSAGFIGRAVTARLEDAGHDVLGIDLEGSPRRDVRNWFRNDENPVPFDLVVHCAAVVGGRALIEDSPMAHAANLELDAALFRWAERSGPGRVVYVSSVAAYPRAFQHAGSPPLTEGEVVIGDPLMPDQLYGWAKLTGEYLAARSSVPVSVPRPFTVYGDGQVAVHPFANLLAQVRERRDPVTVWGSGNQVRDFIHVEDVAAGILAMAEQGIDGPVNLCTGVPVSLRDLAGMMAAEAGYSPEIVPLHGKPEGLPCRVGNPARLHEFYVPRISLQEGIRRGLQ